MQVFLFDEVDSSTNVEDSHNALSSTVDCALTSTDDSIIRTPIVVTRNSRQCGLLAMALKIHSHVGYKFSLSDCHFCFGLTYDEVPVILNLQNLCPLDATSDTA